jgi:hypothetical protein
MSVKVRRHWIAEEKLQIIEEARQTEHTVSDCVDVTAWLWANSTGGRSRPVRVRWRRSTTADGDGSDRLPKHSSGQV